MVEKEKTTPPAAVATRPPVDKPSELVEKLKTIDVNFNKRDEDIAELFEKEEISPFVFATSDLANVARTIKDICDALGITREDFYAAHLNSMTQIDADFDEEEGEEGEEEEGEEGEEEEGEQEEESPLLDDEFIKKE